MKWKDGLPYWDDDVLMNYDSIVIRLRLQEDRIAALENACRASETMTNPKRIDSFADRQKITGERATIGQLYVCGCGNDRWLLLTNGDCVCDSCRRAQARIIVNELAAVDGRDVSGS